MAFTLPVFGVGKEAFVRVPLGVATLSVMGTVVALPVPAFSVTVPWYTFAVKPVISTEIVTGPDAGASVDSQLPVLLVVTPMLV